MGKWLLAIINVPKAIVYLLVSLLLYGISAFIVFIALSLRLNTKRVPKIIPQMSGNPDNKKDYANRRANTGWPTQYIKYAKSNYFQIFWRNKDIGSIFSSLTNAKNKSTDNNSPKDVSYLTPIPLEDKSLDSVHNDNLT